MNKTDLKQCSQCREAKLLECFSPAPSVKGGVNHRCRDCHRERMREYRATAAGRAASEAADRRHYARRKAQNISGAAAA